MFEFTKRKKFALIGMLVLIICVAAVNNKLQTEQGLSANADYTNYEKEQIKEHDGDVLVDSLSISKVNGKSSAAAITGSAAKTSKGGIDSASIVTSDDYAELSNADTYFEEVRATLSMDRNQVISMLTDVIAESPDGPEKNNATQQKLKIIDYMNKEKVIENLIQTKGYAEALVVMTDTSVNVTLNKADVSQTDVAKICDIVMRETGRDASQIVIQSKS